MKKILQIIILISFSLNGLHAKKFGQCDTQEEALNMMIASQVHGSKLMQDYENALRLSSTAMDIYNQKSLKNSKEYENVELLLKKAQKAEELLKSYKMDSMFYSRLLVNKKYQETCDRFIALAKQYNFDIKKDSKTTLKVDTHKNESTCKGEDAAGVLLFLLKDPEVSKNPKIRNQLNALGLDMIQNPDLACKKLKKLAPSVGQSYETLLVRAKKRMSAVKKIVDTSTEIRKGNEKNNKTVTRNMAKDLFFKRKDFSDKISEVRELWFTLYRTASKATIRNKKLIKFLDRKRDSLDALDRKFTDEFTDKIEENIGNGHYDIAWKDYKKLRKKYDKLLGKSRQEYQTFLDTQLEKITGNVPSKLSEKGKKYQAIVKVLNTFMPKVEHSFTVYVRGCGSDAQIRKKQMYTDLGNNEKVKIANFYTFIHPYYRGHYKKSALKNIDYALKIDAFKSLDNTLIAYKQSILDFTEVFDEAYKYYHAKAYEDDNYKKGDVLHPKVISSYKTLMKNEKKLKKMISNISQEQTDKKLNHYKDNNQIVFYHAEKIKKLSRQFMQYASSKDDPMVLDSKEIKKLYDLLYTHMQEVEKFRIKNGQLLKENTNFRYYFEQYSEYILKCKSFYKRVKSKKLYEDEFEKEMMENLPENAKKMMMANREGSLETLKRSYANLVRQYNRLNMH